MITALLTGNVQFEYDKTRSQFIDQEPGPSIILSVTTKKTVPVQYWSTPYCISRFRIRYQVSVLYLVFL